MNWLIRQQNWDVSEGGRLMGILNATPDSFSDGGQFIDPARAVEHALALVNAGAEILDIGGESTRPGSDEVSVEEEIGRVVPVLRAVRAVTDVAISIDTRHTEVARVTLSEGADIINDVAGLRAEGMVELCAERDCAVVVMHMVGEPKTMQDAPVYGDVVAEVREFFERRFVELTTAGIRPERICWDPGIGFSKTLEHNLQLLAHMDALQVAGRPVLLGLSRKRMLGAILGDTTTGRGALSTAVMTVWGHLHGAQIHRVHDVAECAQALALVRAGQSVC